MHAKELGEKIGRALRKATLAATVILIVTDHFPRLFPWLPRPEVRVEQQICGTPANAAIYAPR